jgi:hypothetical protein
MGHIKCTRITDIKQNVKTSSNRSLTSALSQIASLSHTSDRQTTLDFSTSSIFSLRLENYPKVFNKLVAEVDVMADLAAMLPPIGGSAYMIVALLIWTNAKFTETLDVNKTNKMKGKVPVGTLASSTASSGLVTTDAGNLEVELAGADELHIVGKGFSPGSSIFAFEYKIVRRKLLSSLVGKFQPELTTYGPRVVGDKVFAGSPTAEGQEEDEVESTTESEAQRVTGKDEMDSARKAVFVVDEDDVVWTDLLAESRPSEVGFGDIKFALGSEMNVE